MRLWNLFHLSNKDDEEDCISYHCKSHLGTDRFQNYADSYVSTAAS